VDDKEKSLSVHVRNVSKTFGKGSTAIRALQGVDFDVRDGELLMIVGPSGCGKTTLLSVIAGTLRFDSGEIDVLGKPLHSSMEREITSFRKNNIGFIFQQYHLVKTLTCLENVSIPLLLNGVSQIQAGKKAIEMLEKVGLKGREFDLPKKLSGGQQQRVAIARALVHNPRLIICDEPTAALDADTGSSIMKLMQDLVRTPGRSVIVVTHDNRIFKFADRIVRMDDGKIEGILSNYNH